MEKGKLKVSPKLIALLLAGGIALAPVTGMAVTNNSYRPGTFIKEVEENKDIDYGEYIVIEGDNWSHISEKVCSRLRIKITSKYWPTLYKYNKCPKIIKEGDRIKYPKTAEELLALYSDDLEKGNISKVKQATKPYPKLEKLSYNAVGQLLYEIYGDKLECIDPDLIDLYLKVTKLDQKYEMRDIDKELVGDQGSDFTKYIPTVEELKEYQETHKVYKK